MRDHGSIGLPLGMGSFGGFFGFCVLLAFDFSGFFLFLFLFSAGRKSHQHTGFWLAIKGRRPLQVMVSFLFLFACDNSNIVWSEDLPVYFFCFLLIFDRELFFFFSFVYFRSLIGNFSFPFVFFRSLIRNFLCSGSVLATQ